MDLLAYFRLLPQIRGSLLLFLVVLMVAGDATSARSQKSAQPEGGGSPAVRPLRFPPKLDINGLGRTQYAGLVSVAMEATREIMGPLAADEDRRFKARWASYFDYPSQEILDYFSALNPLLTEFLSLRAAVGSASAAFDVSWETAMNAAQYESEEAVHEAFSIAEVQRDALLALKARSDEIVAAMQALGSPPDPVVAKENAGRRHQAAVDEVMKLLATGDSLEGVWLGAEEYEMDRATGLPVGDPLLVLVYNAGTPAVPAYRMFSLTYDEDQKVFTIEAMALAGELLAGFAEDSLTYSYDSTDPFGKTSTAKISATRLAQPTQVLAYPESTRPERREEAATKFYSIIEDGSVTSGSDGKMLKGKAARPQMIREEVEKYRQHLSRHLAAAPAFQGAAEKWLKDRPWTAKADIEKDKKIFTAIFSGMSGAAKPVTAGASIADKPVVSENKKDADKIGADKAEATEVEKEALARKERIEFHQANIVIVTRNLERDRDELARESDPQRRADLEFRIVHALSDMQQEKDLVMSFATGTFVHQRTAFDDYAHAGFIQNIEADQRRFEAFQHSTASLYRLAGMLPGSEGAEARDFVDRRLTLDARVEMDHAIVGQIASALGKKVEGHYQGEMAKSEEEAAWANLGLEAAQNVRSVADKTMMVCSLFGGRPVDLAYQSLTGYVEGGPAEAALRAASYFGTAASTAADAVRGYRDSGVSGALSQGALSFAMSKGMEYGIGKVLGGKPPQGASPSPHAASSPAGSVSKKPSPAALTAKPGGTGATAAQQQELASFNRARAEGEARVKEFQQAQQQLQSAGQAGKSAQEIMQLQTTVRDKAAAVNDSMHAKNYLKYKGESTTQKAYNAHLGAVHAEVEAKFHQKMQEQGWNQQPIKEFRNAGSKGSVGMDFDIGLDEARVRSLAKNNKAASLNQWQGDAQKAWNEAYQNTTGRSAGKAWETVTTSTHAESYKDLAWLGTDKTKVSAAWSQQAADVSRYKGWHMLNDPRLSRMEAMQEVSRGTAKDIGSKLQPLLNNAKPKGEASVRALNNARKHWAAVGETLTAFGDNSIDPLTAERRIRELTGGKSIPEVMDQMGTMMEGLAKFGKG